MLRRGTTEEIFDRRICPCKRLQIFALKLEIGEVSFHLLHAVSVGADGHEKQIRNIDARTFESFGMNDWYLVALPMSFVFIRGCWDRVWVSKE